MTYHPYHMVNPSPWPLLMALSIGSMITGLAYSLTSGFDSCMKFWGWLFTNIFAFLWSRDIIREATYLGYHTNKVYEGLKLGMLLFILSEILFFFSFFWTYFHGMLAPDLELGLAWPPKGINNFNPFQIPLLNTLILLSSGISITWSHHSLINNKTSQSILSLKITIALGLYFSILQAFEYFMAPFTMADSMFGSIFFLATGFHGLHVLIGTLFILVSLFRMNTLHFNKFHHFGFEASAWYWHFVDVVWMFLYLFMYWWIF